MQRPRYRLEEIARAARFATLARNRRHDATVLVCSALTLALTAVVAAYLPARHASGQPMHALQHG